MMMLGGDAEQDVADYRRHHVADAGARRIRTPRRITGRRRSRRARGRRRRYSTTPWISVSVTMSPLAMCATSCASTASASSRVIPCRSKPVDTATSALLRVAPVWRSCVLACLRGLRLLWHGNARLSGQAGHRVEQPVPALFAGCLITRAPVDHSGQWLRDEQRDGRRCRTPITGQAKPSSMPRSRLLAERKRLTPSRLVRPSTTITAGCWWRETEDAFHGVILCNQLVDQAATGGRDCVE